MKKLLIIALVLATTAGFSQDRERKQEMQQKMKQEKQDFTPQQRADLKTKRLALHLDLTAAQQEEIKKLHLEMANERAEKSAKFQKNSEQTGYYQKTNARLEMRKDYQDKMKTILTESQYNAWKENMKRGKKNKSSFNRNKKQ
ncbi:hypothetical protein [Planktosalinus lacus]|uniref:DUF4890 domain-containing protein n=1 Tax=Planktosalinus lacus TaxID=1526573 RepID=A0A8J2Y5P6_9FLAO|nr:hypothetical protein [Planktosalinus lacus]GGD86877.1 hypothetical protein GCM10011312_08640 [Planktosalinus lacus]